ncbi:NAD-dependent epimerase/dehydratase family protein [Heliobacterium gestii]|uniref:NAD-dependent epimerase/dehydratase family protein n=1 Tax=Heliomicrobium gestii TaxID=2699 RepID=A0A845LF11_HELGE|nr:SDR family oxidoreductase [Heliomicrobium gestii]MBM7866685.1 UDP-glucose 4-epimerase [Heliomicrobium gestii]MZP43035.1 NAD-dependent epimerase/dehydratase family protein [Heliomicrobium gestii]
MLRSIVTGGAGFIGSHLVELLLAEGHHVIVLDNLANGRLGNLPARPERGTLEFHRVDISADPSQWEALFQGVDYVFHLAALADIVPSIQNPLTYYRANVDGTVHVLEAARKHQVRKLVYAASSSCYGLAKQFPTPETAPITPEYPYALTKWLGEQSVLHWERVYGLPALSLRLFNVYGPRARTSGTYGAVFGVFLAQKIHGKPFTVVGDGTQRRDFTFVKDVVNAFWMAAQSPFSGEVMNVGSGDSYSINRLVELLGGEVTYIPKRPGEPDCTFADTAKIRERLGWKPKYSFEEGVQVMLEHIRYWADAPIWTPQRIEEATKDWFRYLSK